jgi:hypothetical protein
VTALIVVIGLFFLSMGLLALASPERISSIFGSHTLTIDGRNEVRAVYGGYGVAMAALLLAAPHLPSIRQGVLLCVAAALAGMAGGRVLALIVERPSTFYPSWFYCGLEAAMALALLAAAPGP